MVTSAWRQTTGELPRIISPTLLWAGGCLDIAYGEAVVHGHFSVYLIRGSEKSILIDTGHPKNWLTLEAAVEAFLDGRPLDYLFLTHPEFPHIGLLPQWMEKYPALIGIGDVRDYDLFYPEYLDRLKQVEAGDRIELGDRHIVVVPSVWRDLLSTLWAFDTKERILFVADAFAYLHYHEEGQCDMLTSEHAPPDVRMIQFFNEISLQWTRFTDVKTTFADLDDLLRMLDPLAIAGAHSGFIDTKEEMTRVIKEGMNKGAHGRPEAVQSSILTRPSRR